MLLQKCLKVLPIVTNNIKANRTLQCRSTLFEIASIKVSSFNVYGKGDIRLSSTETNSKKVTNEVKQVYYGVLTPQIRAVKMFSLSSSIVGIVAQPFLYQEIAGTGNIPVIIAAYSFIGFFTVVTPVLLHLITKKYITHLEYKENTDSYVARTVNFFCMTKETEFKTEEVKIPEVPGMFTTFIAKGKSLFLDPRLFEQPEHYAKIMGYDKPLDFKMYDTPPSSEEKK